MIRHNSGMEIEWDEGKDAANRAKHGVSLGEAVHLDWAGAKYQTDDRRSYGETRVVAFALIAGRLHVCVFVNRSGSRRIISLRKANKREIRNYGQSKEHTPD
jgi:uncharacterized protein